MYAVPELIFATHNKHKASEIRAMLPTAISIQTLLNIGITGEIEETGDTIEENALLKARFVYQKLKTDCFADDTALEVDALNGQPGVFSARYAGAGKNADDNITKLLSELNRVSNRSAIFKTTIAAIIMGKEFLFNGIVKGSISKVRMGQNGFGYDPVFVPVGSTDSFAQMSPEEKNKFSHRAIAVKKFANFLQTTFSH